MPQGRLTREPTGRVDAVIDRARPVAGRLSRQQTGRVPADLDIVGAGE